MYDFDVIDGSRNNSRFCSVHYLLSSLLEITISFPLCSPHLHRCSFLILTNITLIETSFLLLCRMLARSPALPLVTAETPAFGFFITAVRSSI